MNPARSRDNADRNRPLAPAPRRPCSSSPASEQKNRALRAAAAALRAHRTRSWRPTSATCSEAQRRAATHAAARPAAARREARRGHGARPRGHRRSCPTRSAPCSPNGRGRTACASQRRRVPLGVIGIIYESRPNVTADAGALCLKSGNAVILRGGSESVRSNTAIHACLAEGLQVAGLPRAMHPAGADDDRAAVGDMLAEMTELHRRHRAARRQASSSSGCSAKRACR